MPSTCRQNCWNCDGKQLTKGSEVTTLPELWRVQERTKGGKLPPSKERGYRSSYHRNNAAAAANAAASIPVVSPDGFDCVDKGSTGERVFAPGEAAFAPGGAAFAPLDSPDMSPGVCPAKEAKEASDMPPGGAAVGPCRPPGGGVGFGYMMKLAVCLPEQAPPHLQHTFTETLYCPGAAPFLNTRSASADRWLVASREPASQ